MTVQGTDAAGVTIETDPPGAKVYLGVDNAAALDSHRQTAHFKKYLAEAVPLLASRERHVWKRAAP